MSSCIGLVYFESLVASRLSYELGVHGEKKINGNWDIIDKNGHNTVHISKPGNFNSLREIT